MVSDSPGTRGGRDIWSKRAMHSKDSDWSIEPKLIPEVSQKFFILIESGSCWKKALVLESEEPNSSLGFIMNPNVQGTVVQGTVVSLNTSLHLSAP